MITDAQYIEIFHLLLLDQLGRRIPKEHYALKGGCNLRFFLKSIRYSQDMDLDIRIMRKETLCNAVRKILNSHPFRLILQAKQIEIMSVTEPKQTETTQRWKIHLQVPTNSIPLQTKVEFSRRKFDEGVLFEFINSSIVSSYQLAPIYASHYSMETAFIQKIWALILRTQTQARDLFDLFHLLNMGASIVITNDIRTHLTQAQENALSISFETFKSQVLSYLPFDYQEQYNDPALWKNMVSKVIDYLCNL